MDHTPETPQKQSGLFGAADIEVQRVFREKGHLYVAFSDRKHNWLMKCEPKDLQSFTAFQRRAMKECGVWIGHYSQDRARAAARSEEWNDAIREAVNRGGEGRRE